MVGFGPSRAKNHNGKCLRFHWLIFRRFCGGRGLTWSYRRHPAVRSRLVPFRIVQNSGLPARIPDRCIDAARRRLEVTKEAGLSSLFPIWRIVGIDTGARMQHTKKGMLIGIDDDPSMSAPDSQVTRLRTCDSPKLIGPLIKVRRARVLIKETGALIEFMDKMGAIGREICMTMARIQRGAQNRQTLIRS